MKWIVSARAVGTPIKAIPSSARKHQFFAIVTRSPHGCGASPYLVRPLCSIELNETITSYSGLYPLDINRSEISLGSTASCYNENN